jgi:hypothetical protein
MIGLKEKKENASLHKVCGEENSRASLRMELVF